jgi:choline dehydrogenase-like flavoprotein
VSSHNDLLVIGSGFGSLFFLKKFMQKYPKARVQVIEWGTKQLPSWQIEHARNSLVESEVCHNLQASTKPWNYTIGLGGGTNCWFGQAPRLVPADFALKSRFGVGDDWPFGYEELEPYYTEAESIMAISGSNHISRVSPRSGSYPLAPHIGSDPDRIMSAAQPNLHFPIATARASVATQQRTRCCATNRCNICPVGAKFTAHNGMRDVLEHPNIRFSLGCEVQEIVHVAGSAKGVRFRNANGEVASASADLIVLGANGIQSPAILLRSDLNHPMTGVGLCEQVGHEYEVLLKGVSNFGGSTITTGLNYSLYTALSDRSRHGAALLYFENRPKYGLRLQTKRWRESLPLVVNIEDLPQKQNRVIIDDSGKAAIVYKGHSAYAERGLANVNKRLAQVLSPLPVEKIVDRGARPTESHIQCTLRGGADSQKFVVDGFGRHHGIDNLYIVGSATFTTCPPANPSLTVAAMALRTADLI